MSVRACVCVYESMCVCVVFECESVCMSVRACVCVYMSVRACVV